MGKEKKLAENLIIYTIGNFGSKVLTFLIVPLYSFYIAPDSLGQYDLIATTVAALLPIIIFQLTDAIFRWMLNEQPEIQREVISTSLTVITINTLIAGVIFLLVNYYFISVSNIWLIMFYAVVSIYYPVFQQVTRGLGNNKLYSFCGVLNTLIFLTGNVVGLVFLHLGIESLLFSQIIASVVCIAVMIFQQKELRYALKINLNGPLQRKLLKYSVPLIPNSMCWWAMNASDRYIVTFFLGSYMNGILSMAHKFPTILATLTNIFYLAWQESAITEYESDNRNEFFTKIFNLYSTLLLSCSLWMILGTKVAAEFLLAVSYREAWKYTGFLYLGAVFNALCSFLGIGYAVSKDTQKSMLSTMVAAGINIAVNIFCIKLVGLHAASISTFVAYAVLFSIRVKHTKRYFEINYNMKLLLGLLLINMLAILITFLCSAIICVIFTLIGCTMFLVINRNILLPYTKKLKK